METTNLNPQNTIYGQQVPQTIIVNQEAPQKNGIGIAGFVMSITGLILCWVPVLKWLLLAPAFILSVIGSFKKPKALAIVGAVISAIVIFILMVVKASILNGLANL